MTSVSPSVPSVPSFPSVPIVPSHFVHMCFNFRHLLGKNFVFFSVSRSSGSAGDDCDQMGHGT